MGVIDLAMRAAVVGSAFVGFELEASSGQKVRSSDACSVGDTPVARAKKVLRHIKVELRATSATTAKDYVSVQGFLKVSSGRVLRKSGPEAKHEPPENGLKQITLPTPNVNPTANTAPANGIVTRRHNDKVTFPVVGRRNAVPFRHSIRKAISPITKTHA